MATLIRPATGSSKELILKISPKRGTIFTKPELYSFVGVDFVLVQLMSGDILLLTKSWEESSSKNDLASILTRKSVYGTALIVETQEID